MASSQCGLSNNLLDPSQRHGWASTQNYQQPEHPLGSRDAAWGWLPPWLVWSDHMLCAISYI